MDGLHGQLFEHLAPVQYICEEKEEKITSVYNEHSSDHGMCMLAASQDMHAC